MIIDIQRYWGENQIWHATELCSKIIQSMLTDKIVTLRSKECRSGIDSGLYKLLDDLCYYWQWDPSAITIETVNPLEYHSKYNIVFIPFLYFEELNLSKIVHKPWNKEKVYGMFLGRANTTRIRGAHNHNTFKYKDKGLTSFNHDIKWQIDDNVFIDYMSQTDQRFSEMTSITPYSDIGEVITPPITGLKTFENWGDIYEKIGIELVFETSESSNNLTITEKILRPLLYKRPFILITGKNNIQKLKDPKILNRQPITSFDNAVDKSLIAEWYAAREKPLRFFENVLDIKYDTLDGIYRVDQAFCLIKTLIDNGNINQIIENCQEDIEHNYNYITKVLSIATEITAQAANAFDYTTWGSSKYK